MSQNQITDDASVIPAGLYCYEGLGYSDDTKSYQIKLCPYWSCDPTKPEQECGYCSFLKRGDWEADHWSLLWDQVKECGINYDIEED
jgi:hypothetical protein